MRPRLPLRLSPLAIRQDSSSTQQVSKLLGRLSVGYTGVPLVTRKCTAGQCRVGATYAVQLSYNPPLWFLPVSVMVAIHSSFGLPTVGLSFAQILPHSSPIFAFAESGNAEGIKQLFAKKLASPFDISAQTGDQPLHVGQPSSGHSIVCATPWTDC
jgi:hypothetical protein